MDGGEVDKRVFENFLLESTDVGFPIDVIGHSLEVIWVRARVQLLKVAQATMKRISAKRAGQITQKISVRLRYLSS